jgi:hypothetical protein
MATPGTKFCKNSHVTVYLSLNAFGDGSGLQRVLLACGMPYIVGTPSGEIKLEI